MVVGDYIIRKGQRKALYVKEGGVILAIDELTATVTDGERTGHYSISDLRPFKPSDNTLFGCHLIVGAE